MIENLIFVGVTGRSVYVERAIKIHVNNLLRVAEGFLPQHVITRDTIIAVEGSGDQTRLVPNFSGMFSSPQDIKPRFT